MPHLNVWRNYPGKLHGGIVPEEMSVSRPNSIKKPTHTEIQTLRNLYLAMPENKIQNFMTST